MIPKIIWQTYKDPIDQLPDYMHDAMQTWKNLNPNYEHRYMDDKQAEEFVLEYFGQEWLDIFKGLPVGVMRGDLWRYMVVYIHGGVYADLDTECWEPISVWLKEDMEMIVCPENDIHYCQWTFAASPKHPILKSVLDYIKEKLENPDYEQDHFVHIYTGPDAWTHGISRALNFKSDNLIEDSALINESENAKLYKFHCYGGDHWRIFHFLSVKHLYGSQTWKDGNYVQWIEDPLVKGKR
jgi:mannosyltransferase OCH1-like enzyme